MLLQNAGQGIGKRHIIALTQNQQIIHGDGAVQRTQDDRCDNNQNQTDNGKIAQQLEHDYTIRTTVRDAPAITVPQKFPQLLCGWQVK